MMKKIIQVGYNYRAGLARSSSMNSGVDGISNAHPENKVSGKKSVRSYKDKLKFLKDSVKDSFAHRIANVMQGNKEMIAMNLAGFYALECGIGIICEKKDVTIMQVLQQIKNKTLNEEDMLLIARFANATWKAGQPFRGIERIERDTFRPAALLEKDELKKDFDQIYASADKLLEKMVSQGVNFIDSKEVQLEVLHKTLKDQDFAIEIAQWLNDQYYINTGQNPPAFLEQEETIEDLFVEIEAKAQKIYLKMEFEDLINNIKEQILYSGETLSKEDEDRIRDIAYLVMDAHKDQKRSEGLPYFVHQLDVTKTLVEVLGVTNPLFIQIALLHDTSEDVPEKYQEIKERLSEKISMLPEGSATRMALEKDMALIRLGVRMLSNTGYDMKTYSDQLLFPQKYYDKFEAGDSYYADYNDQKVQDAVKGVALVKIADILSNAASIGNLFENGLELTEKQQRKPQKAFDKLFNIYIPEFIEKLPPQFNEIKSLFSDKLKEILIFYANNKSPQAVALRNAAKNALDNDFWN